MAAILESNRREPGGLFPPSPCRAKARTPQHGQPLGIGLQQPRAAWTSHAGLPSTAATRIPGAPLSQRTRRRTRTRMQVRSLHSLRACGTHSASCFAENQNFLVPLFADYGLLGRSACLAGWLAWPVGLLGQLAADPPLAAPASSSQPACARPKTGTRQQACGRGNWGLTLNSVL